MSRCPITYEPLAEGQTYSPKGLRQIHRNLKSLAPLEFTAEEQRREAINRAGKMSVQGLQLKLSAVLRASAGRFEIVDQGGRYILKPPSLDFPELPENEGLTMRMAAVAGMDVPTHGLVRARDGSFTYFIQRFDRIGRVRLPLEDFAQLTDESRDTKYNSSMEKVAGVIDRFCTFSAIERAKLFTRVLFSFLIGNEDMHLKNFSLITRDQKTELAPAYDFLNTTIALKNAKEELALPLNGKKSKFTRNDLVNYFARERLQLNEGTTKEILSRFTTSIPAWHDLLSRSFLSAAMKEKYAAVLTERARRLQL